MQVSDVMPQLVAMGGMGFEIVRSIVEFSMFALKLLTGAKQSLTGLRGCRPS